MSRAAGHRLPEPPRTPAAQWGSQGAKPFPAAPVDRLKLRDGPDRFWRRGGLLALLAGALLLAGCATQRPVLYPNNTYQQSGSQRAETAIRRCEQLADQTDLRRGEEELAAETAGGAAVGSATGAAIGAVHGSAGRGAAAGAAGGAAQAFTRGLFRARDPGPLYKRYVNRCLSQRGYEVIGWR